MTYPMYIPFGTNPGLNHCKHLSSIEISRRVRVDRSHMPDIDESANDISEIRQTNNSRY